jgi:hypothetical protein
MCIYFADLQNNAYLRQFWQPESAADLRVIRGIGKPGAAVRIDCLMPG